MVFPISQKVSGYADDVSNPQAGLSTVVYVLIRVEHSNR